MKMKWEIRAGRGFIILLAACSDGSAVQDPMDLDPTVGVISGSVRDSDGLAIAGADALVQPGDLQATSNGQGLTRSKSL